MIRGIGLVTFHRTSSLKLTLAHFFIIPAFSSTFQPGIMIIELVSLWIVLIRIGISVKASVLAVVLDRRTFVVTPVGIIGISIKASVLTVVIDFVWITNHTISLVCALNAFPFKVGLIVNCLFLALRTIGEMKRIWISFE
jgi:hypothetical protein